MANDLAMKERILKQHSINYYWKSGRLYAVAGVTVFKGEHRYFEDETVNVTDWTIKQLMSWLGY